MNGIVSPFSGGMTNTPEPSPESFEKLVDHIFNTTDLIDRVKFYGWVLSNHSHIQHRHDVALATAAGVTPNTAYNWTRGISECTKAGLLYAKVRMRYPSEMDVAKAFGEYINRDLIEEVFGK